MDKNSKIILGIVIAVVIIGGIWLGASRKAAAPVVEKEDVSSEPIRIGVIGHFSGEYASYGVPMKQAIELAIEEVNKKNGIDGRQVNLIIEDDAGDSVNAASGMNKLINIDKVDYIISTQGSGATSAVTPIAQNNAKILMITLGSAPELTNVGEYVFRSIPSDVYQGIRMVDFIDNTLKSDKVAGLYINDAYGVGIKSLIKNNINAELAIQEMFNEELTDFRSQLLKIKNSGADTLILVSRKETPNILKQIKELGLGDMKIIASETVKDDKILEQAGGNAEGVYIVFTGEPKDYINFKNNYKTKFNEEPSAYSMYAYDGAIALIKAINENGDDLEKIKNGLLNINFKGASGNVVFDADRERIGMEYIMYVVKNGEFVLYEEN